MGYEESITKGRYSEGIEYAHISRNSRNRVPTTRGTFSTSRYNIRSQRNSAKKASQRRAIAYVQRKRLSFYQI